MKKLILACVFLLSVTACTFVGGQADKRLGDPCNADTRVMRAVLFERLMTERYGNIADPLAKPLSAMQEAKQAGASLDPSGDAYRFAFIQVAVKILADAGKDVALGGFAEAIEKLRGLPELAVEINLIESRIATECAKVSTS